MATKSNRRSDHYWEEYQTDLAKPLSARNPAEFRGKLVELTPEFGLIRDVADAHKHFKLNRTDRNVTHATQTAVGAMGWGEAAWNHGTWGGTPEVIVTFDDGSKHHFSMAVAKVMSMWQKLLGRAE